MVTGRLNGTVVLVGDDESTPSVGVVLSIRCSELNRFISSISKLSSVLLLCSCIVHRSEGLMAYSGFNVREESDCEWLLSGICCRETIVTGSELLPPLLLLIRLSLFFKTIELVALLGKKDSRKE